MSKPKPISLRCDDEPLPLKWEPFDFSDWVHCPPELEHPTIARVTENRCLFYAARLNEIHAEPAVGKSNILIDAVGRILRDNGKVIYIDPEDSPRGFWARATSMGIAATLIADRSRFQYIHNPEPGAFTAGQRMAMEWGATTVIADGVAELMAVSGFNEDVAGDCLVFFRTYIRPFADAGAAVVLADHVTKDSGGRAAWSRGSGAKLGRYDGAVYDVRLAESYRPARLKADGMIVPGKNGGLKLVVSKDRNGQVGAKGEHVLNMRVSFDGPGVTSIEWEEIVPKEALSHEPRIASGLTKAMAAILTQLQKAAVSKATLCDSVPMKKATTLDALKALIGAGFVEVDETGKAHRCALTAESQNLFAAKKTAEQIVEDAKK